MIVQSDSYLEIFLCACGFFFTKAVLLITDFFFRNKFKIAAAGVLNGLRELELNQTLREHMVENQSPSALRKALNIATAWACRVCQ